MSDSFEFTLHSPMTKEDWNKISDVKHENTISVTFRIPQGRHCRKIMNVKVAGISKENVR